MFFISSSFLYSLRNVPTCTHTYYRCNHYNVLKLNQNCSSKEIKESFLKLSKKYHPDVNKSKDAHRLFLAINEAYKTLSNKHSRQLYDSSLGNGRNKPLHSNGVEPNIHVNYGYRPQEWNNTEKPYYGIKGIKKVSNFTIVLICISVMFLGFGLQMILIKKSITFRRRNMLKRSQEAEETLNKVTHIALNTTREEQLEILKLRLREK